MTPEQLHPHGPRGPILAGMGLALVIACTSTPQPQYQRYEDWQNLMEHEMRPLEGAFTDELSKDPADTDYKFIADSSRRGAYYFSLFSATDSRLHCPDAVERASAEKARAWLLDLATAADRREHATLVNLMMQCDKICTQCHEDPGE